MKAPISYFTLLNTKMGKTSSIIRRSIFSFLQKYQYFTTTSAFLALPFSISLLLSQTFVLNSSISILQNIFNHFNILFDAAGFPTSHKFFSIFTQKISQTIFSSIFTLPFTLTFLLIAKSSVLQAFKETNPSFSSITSLYNPLLLTHICNSVLILSANSTVFAILFFSFNFLQDFGFSSPITFLWLSSIGAIIYSIALANTMIITNLSLALSGMERLGGYLAILKACVLIRGKTSTALLLALPTNLAMAAIEALFQYRVVRAYNDVGRVSLSMAAEGIVVAYLYSVFVVLDTAVSCLFFKSCKAVYWVDLEGRETLQIENDGCKDSETCG